MIEKMKNILYAIIFVIFAVILIPVLQTIITNAGLASPLSDIFAFVPTLLALVVLIVTVEQTLK